MEDSRAETGLATGTGRRLIVALGLRPLVVGVLVVTGTVHTGVTPPYGIAAGLVAAVLGIELTSFGLTGRYFP